MKKSVGVLVHVFFWIAFTGLTFMLSKVYLQADPTAPFSANLIYVNFLELIMGLIFFYMTFFGIRWAMKSPLRWSLLIVVLSILLFLFALPATKVSMLAVLSSVIPHCILIFLAVIFRRFSDSLRLEKEKQELTLQNVRSELAVLKTQLSPHFLFNTLNNIDYLVTSDPVKASDSLSKLGTILRYMIYETEEEKIDLTREIKHVEDYIGLLRLRSESSNFLTFRAGNIGESQLCIAPMLFLPLIENSFKHCSDRNGKNMIDISVSVTGNILLFSISNKHDGTESGSNGAGGLGLNNVKRRLELIYPGRHTLEIDKTGERFNVGLKIELDEY